MNKDLQYLLNTGNITGKRTLRVIREEGPVAYVTEYRMNSKLGPFTWYIVWLDPECPDREIAKTASIYIHDARARMYFPPFLDTRIPPENRVEPQRTKLMRKYGLKEYNKFDYVIATKGLSPIKKGYVIEVEPKDCEYDEIHAIEEIVQEYHRTLPS